VSESQIQTSIVQYLRQMLPSGWIVQSTANKPRSAIQGSIEKKMGAIAGWPDIQILGTGSLSGYMHEAPYAWFLEIKSAKGRVSDAQKDVHDRLRDIGFRVGVARSIDDARALCKRWGLPLREAA
jgi:hypothetical protein